jgi:hypothetical protein
VYQESLIERASDPKEQYKSNTRISKRHPTPAMVRTTACGPPRQISRSMAGRLCLGQYVSYRFPHGERVNPCPRGSVVRIAPAIPESDRHRQTEGNPKVPVFILLELRRLVPFLSKLPAQTMKRRISPISVLTGKIDNCDINSSIKVERPDLGPKQMKIAIF